MFFRTDASLDIGTGHVMRCLTLAAALTARGADCRFICRAHPGHLIEHIRGKGYPVHALAPTEPSDPGSDTPNCPENPYAGWLGASPSTDAEECLRIVSAASPDWIITDHYGIDARWEETLRPITRRLMVVDDLADRAHSCHLLVDQSYGRDAADYRSLVPADCVLLCGAGFAMLRPEFAESRPYSLARRTTPLLRRILVSLGGVDRQNMTTRILDALGSCDLPTGCEIAVVMGDTAPWRSEVRRAAARLPWPTEVLTGVPDMARLMSESDLAIGAAGATSWERCCLGVPTILVVLAANQRQNAQSLARSGAVIAIEESETIANRLPGVVDSLVSDPAALARMSRIASCIADGSGVRSVIDRMLVSCS